MTPNQRYWDHQLQAYGGLAAVTFDPVACLDARKAMGSDWRYIQPVVNGYYRMSLGLDMAA